MKHLYKTIRVCCLLSCFLYTFHTEAATFVVDNAGDADDLLAYTAGNGSNTLRKCMRLANSNANAPTVDVINFNSLPGVGPYQITPVTNLPSIIEPVYINGFTAPGAAAPTPFISVRGGGAGPSPINNAFNISPAGTGSTIRGFAIYRILNDAIYINNAPAITIEGCWIGIMQNGTLPGLANDKVNGHGIYITTNANNCVVGTATAAGRNVISGTLGHGVVVVGSSGTNFKNNYIGTNTTGTAAIPNSFNGINIDNATGAIIGGAAANEGNLISGNTQSGVILANASSNPVIKGNKIGTNAAGTAAIPNGESGLNIFTNVLNVIIGGALAGEGNLISGNTLSGINITLGCTAPVIKGNLIGVNITGTAAIGNLQHGMYISGSNNAIIGGGTKAERNIVSGNGNLAGENGISINGCNGHTIWGNFCGTTINGMTAIPNFDTGLSITASSGNTIGGTLMQRNVLSGNPNFGLFMDDVDNSTITRNYIGTDSTGNAPLGNGVHGVQTQGGCNLNSWTSNVVGGNTMIGMNLLSSTNSTYYDNYCGLGINGTTDVGNGTIGFRFGLQASGNTIGGTAAGQRNYMSGNGDHGIMFDQQSVSNILYSNYVGSDITGLVPVPNNGMGLLLLDGASSNQVGGTGAGQGNLFCCSLTGDGIRTQISSDNTIYGNLIGVNKNGTIAAGFGNAEDGIFLMSYQYLTQANNNTIVGGLAAGAANIIANNGRDGVRLAGYPVATTDFNPIIGNSIYCNGGFGINMENNNAIENQGIVAPVVTTSLANSISGTGTAGNTIHVYRNQYTDGARCDCEGEIYVGTTTVTGGGTWSLTHSLGLTAAQALSVTATQTNATNSTSEFWVCSQPLPVDLLSLEAKKNNTTVSIHFSVINESDIAAYHILRSADGIHFEMIGSVDPLNIENKITNYSFEDIHPLNGIGYYRIQTVELDGRVAHSKIVHTTATSTTYLFPNPATDAVNIVASGIVTRVEVYNSVGQSVLEQNTGATEITIALSHLSTGMYYAKVFEGEKVKVFKVEKK
jgi:hypothetical protein